MTEPVPYLSDDELLAIIDEIEAAPPATAPGDLEERVLSELPRAAQRRRLTPQRQRRSPTAELYRYSLQVITAVSAAILLLFLTPASTTPSLSPPPAPDLWEPRQGIIETLQQRWQEHGGLLNKLWEYNGGSYEKPE